MPSPPSSKANPMTNREALLSLAARVEAGETGRGMDAEVALATGWKPHLTAARARKGFRYEQNQRNKGTFELMYGDMPCGKEKHVPKITTSLDAIAALTERMLSGWYIEVSGNVRS